MTAESAIKTFFISYLTEDRDVAEKITEQIMNCGHGAFFDRRSLEPGDNWVQKIDKAIKDCDYFLLLWSAHGDDRTESYVAVELNLARMRDERRFRADDPFIIPILIGEKTKLPAEFGIDGKQAIRLAGVDIDGEINGAVKKINKKVMKGEEKFSIDASDGSRLPGIIDKIRDKYSGVIANARSSARIPSEDFDAFDYEKAILARIAYIQKCTKHTIENNSEAIKSSIESFKEWMINGTVVRVIGAGRAKLAATMPANRLAHGGACVYEQDGIIPMPHDIKGGGIIAASASGRTPSVLGVLREIDRKKSTGDFTRSPFKVIGIARNDAGEFNNLCDVFIGIHLLDEPNPLAALADTEETVISLVLDALIVSAGWRAGFDDTRWRLGHENLGATGPYDATAVPRQPLHTPHKFSVHGGS